MSSTQFLKRLSKSKQMTDALFWLFFIVLFLCIVYVALSFALFIIERFF